MSLPKFIRHAVWIVPLVASASWVLASTGGVADETDVPQFGPWSAPVNIGSPVNTALPEFQPFITKDGLSLYFCMLEGPNAGDPQDIWVSKHNSKSDPWGIPQRLGPAINTPGKVIEATPFVTIDGHWMYFASGRPGGFGRNDIYVSHRNNKREDFPTDPSGGWQEAVNLGANINTASGEVSPFVFEDEETGVTTLYFNSNRVANQHDIYASTLQPDGTFGPATPVAELNTPYTEQHPMFSRDGLQMYFISDRPGSMIGDNGLPSLDIWVSTRASTSDPWGTPENLNVVNARLGGGPINSMFVEGRPALSFDGTTLYFQNGGSPADLGGQGFFDIWVSTRNKLTGRDKD